ncbi:MAG: hypothetical protein IJP14_02520 [Clostridia bacterium]|nr:hypothetical protein [Clostridia bacterium]
MGNNRFVCALLGIVRFVITAGLCVSLAAVLLLSGLRVLFDREWYVQTTREPAFVEQLQADIADYLEDECLFYGIPFESVKDVLTEQQIQAAAEKRMASVYDALCSGGEPTAVTVDAAPFTAAIQAYFDTLPAEERPLDTEAAGTIATDFASGVASVMQLGISGKIVATAHPAFAEDSLPRRVLGTVHWWAVAVLVLTGLSLIPYGSTLHKRAYSTTGALFIGSALAAVPTWLFVRLDFPASIALGESALREYVQLLLYTVLDRLNVITATAFAISAVLLLASVVWTVCSKKS